MLAKLAIPKSAMLLLLLFFTGSLFAQKSISGKITDADAKPLTGATVKGKDAKEVTVTGDDGTFKLNMKFHQLGLKPKQ